MGAGGGRWVTDRFSPLNFGGRSQVTNVAVGDDLAQTAAV
jgi:hypothetical protein